jgi:hypothetical protein
MTRDAIIRELRTVLPLLSVAEQLAPWITAKKVRDGWMVTCPLPSHAKDETPSCHLRENGHWHCFGCGKGGDVYDLVRGILGCGFREALTWAAERAGYTLPDAPRGEVRRRAAQAKVRQQMAEEALLWARGVNVLLEPERQAMWRLYVPPECRNEFFEWMDRAAELLYLTGGGDDVRLLSLYAEQKTADPEATRHIRELGANDIASAEATGRLICRMLECAPPLTQAEEAVTC